MIGKLLYSTNLPLLLPAGMDTLLDNCGSFDDVESGEIESIIGPPEQIVLNDPNYRKHSPSHPPEPVQDVPCDEGFSQEEFSLEELPEDPEDALRILLTRVIEELQFRNNGQRTVTENDARFLRNLPEVEKMFERTAFLVDIDVSELKSNAEKATCFVINLANLMWLHALIFSDEYNQRGILLKNWPLRHIHLNSVGYNVGQLGFVTLHDLHSLLFNLPNVLRSKKLSTLNVLSDPRIHFLVGQPNAFSPRIEVVSVDTLEQLLEDSKNDYLRKFVIVQDMKLFIPMPLLLFIERISYDQEDDLDVFRGSNDTAGSDKLSVLMELLRSKSLPYEKLLAQDIYLVMSTRFKIKFSHSLNELDDMTTLNTVVWRSCRLHRSLYICLTQQTNIVRQTMLDDHLSEVACACSDKSNRAVCVNNSLLTMAKVFRPMLHEFHTETSLTHKGLRCLYAILAYTGAASTTLTDRHMQRLEESRNIYKVIEADFLRIPTVHICAKIKLCLTVLVSEYDIHKQWPRWCDMYFADPNAVLLEIVERGNAALACMWMGVELKYRREFEFSNEASKAFYSLLWNSEDASYVKEAYAFTPDVPLSRIVDALISSRCPISKLQTFVSAVVSIDDLSEEERVKYLLLLIGLKMISCIKLEEQIYYHKIVYSPQLIVEQLILNKQTETLKGVLTSAMRPMPALLEKLLEQDSQLRHSIDDLLRRYAEKALHFHKATTAAQCQSAALLHASIFMDGDAFYPPEKTPTEEEWIPNNLAAECLVCKKAFSVFTRRHHCRRCGRVVCSSCSLWRLKLSMYNSPQRACEACFTFERQFEEDEDGDSSQQSSLDGEEKRGKRPLWVLDMDPAVNERIRYQAIFDTAPDIELCFSLLQLHTENSGVPRFLLANAHVMLKILRQRLVCPANFDYPLVSQLVKSLLLAAKVYCAHMGDVQGARQCEELTSESVMLNQMAKSNVAPPRPNKPIRDVQDWKQIRNIALEQQNWELALEVSTKNGLECGSIWYLWAMHVLKSGDWSSARDKFARSNLKRNTHMLNGIIEILRASVEKEPPKGLAKFFQSNPKKGIMPVNVLEECLYYLRLYGSGDQLFDFLVDHGRTFEAVQTAYAKKIAAKKFVKRIYVPHLEKKEHGTILKYMENVDLTLVGWKEYGHEICVYCSGAQQYQALYETQLWLQDYYRAGLSCTMFYKTGARCYADFQKNKHHLVAAVAHFLLAIVNASKQENAKVDQVIDPRKIEKCARTVNLQLDISDLVCKNADCAARILNPLPTLFGVNDERLSVILLLVDACNSWSEASPLVQSVIEAYCMDTGAVFKRIALRLMETGRESVVKTLIEYVKANHEIVAGGKENHVALIDTLCAEVVRAKPEKPDEFIAFVTDDALKFELHIECGYLKSAYLLAVKMKRIDLVERAMTEAQRLNKPSIVKICRTKLQLVSKQS